MKMFVIENLNSLILGQPFSLRINFYLKSREISKNMRRSNKAKRKENDETKQSKSYDSSDSNHKVGHHLLTSCNMFW
jgi:hypothetical protein